MAVLLITHDLGVVAELCHRVAVIYGGRIVELAPVRSLFAQPIHPYTGGCSSASPTRAGSGSRWRPSNGVPPDLRQRGLGCRFAPRCAHAIASCRRAIRTRRACAGHFVACPVVT